MTRKRNDARRERLRTGVGTAGVILCAAIFLVAATTTTAGTIHWLRGDHFYPRLSTADARWLVAGRAGDWLPGVLATLPADADLDFVPDRKSLGDSDWTAAYYLYPRSLHVPDGTPPVGSPGGPPASRDKTRPLLRHGQLTGPLLPTSDDGKMDRTFPPGAVSWRGGLAWLLTAMAAWGWGGLIIRWLGNRRDGAALGASAPLHAGLSLITGLGWLGTLGSFAALVGGAGQWLLVAGSTGAGVACLVGQRLLRRAGGIRFRDRRERARDGRSTDGATGPGRRTRAVARLMCGVLAACICAAVAASFARAVSEPMVHWDERFQWAYKAKVLLAEGGINGPTFQDADRPHLHRHYPLLIPALEAHVARLAGGFGQERAVKALFPLFLAGLLLVVYGASRQVLPPWLALLVTATLAALPPLHHATRTQGGPAHTGFADLPLAAFMAATATALALWQDHRGSGSRPDISPYPFALLAALHAGYALLTKPEGVVGAAAVFIVIAVLATRLGREGVVAPVPWRQRLAPAGVSLAILVTLSVPRLVIATTVPDAGTVGFTGDAAYLSRLAGPGLATALGANLVPAVEALVSAPFTRRWSGIGWLPLLGLLAAPALRRRPSHLLSLLLGLPLAADLAAFTLTGSQIEWHLSVALDRVWIQLLGVLFIIIARQIALYREGPGAV
ncbi:MAG: hypothetical protein ACE5IK_09980 [Acidobacteriota bacterium]